MSQIEELGRRIGRAFDADRVVLFGSYVRGLATDDSDVDLNDDETVKREGRS